MYIHTYEEMFSGWTVVAFESHRSVDDVVEMKKWCHRTYGPPLTRWKDDIPHGEVRFEDPKDVLMFILRWS